MTVNTRVNIVKWQRKKEQLRRTIVPDATRRAINDLAFQAQSSIRSALVNTAEGGPTPFTRTAIRVDQALRSRPFAVVKLGPEREYLHYFFGTKRGARRPTGTAEYIYVPLTSVPGHKINARGNLSGRRLGAVFERMRRQRFYWVDQGSRILVFKRTGRRGRTQSTLVGVLLRTVDHERKVDAETIGKKIVRRRARQVFEEKIASRIARAYGASRG